MSFLKSLMIRRLVCFGGCSMVCALCAQYTGEMNIDIGKANRELLIWAVGLNCGSANDGGECSPFRDLKIVRGKESGEDIRFLKKKGKMKVYSGDGDYGGGLRFSIEDSDIQLTTKSPLSTLSQYENYGIEKGEDGKLYLSRKSNSNEGRVRELGLPSSCSLPENEGEVKCYLNSEQLRSVSFEGRGKQSGLGVSAEGEKNKSRRTRSILDQTTLNIKKKSDSKFPMGYIFNFRTHEDLQISSNNVIKSWVETTFKIKMKGNKLTLERTWAKEEDLIKKVGLSCDKKGDCSVISSKLNVHVNGVGWTGKNRGEGNGKIKLSRGVREYNQGFKFVIEEADISLTGGTKDSSLGRGTIDVLGEFDEYQIEEIGGTWYLSRKKEGKSKKWSELKLGGECSSLQTVKMKTNLECIHDSLLLAEVNFYGRNSNSGFIDPYPASSRVKIHKAEDSSSYPLGKKITFRAENQDIKIPLTSGKKMVLWKDAEVEFKIRKENKKWSLERSIDVNEEVKDLGLSDCNDEGGCLVGEKINVHVGDTWIKEAKVTGSGRRIKYQTGHSGYHKTIKFQLENDIELGETEDKSKENVQKIEKGAYEIKENGGIWYISKKN